MHVSFCGCQVLFMNIVKFREELKSDLSHYYTNLPKLFLVLVSDKKNIEIYKSRLQHQHYHEGVSFSFQKGLYVLWGNFLCRGEASPDT